MKVWIVAQDYSDRYMCPLAECRTKTEGIYYLLDRLAREALDKRPFARTDRFILSKVEVPSRKVWVNPEDPSDLCCCNWIYDNYDTVRANVVQQVGLSRPSMPEGPRPEPKNTKKSRKKSRKRMKRRDKIVNSWLRDYPAENADKKGRTR